MPAIPAAAGVTVMTAAVAAFGAAAGPTVAYFIAMIHHIICENFVFSPGY